MLHYLFALLIMVHGLIHLFGYSHTLQLTEREDNAGLILLSKGEEKVVSLFWVVPYLLFIATMILFMSYSNLWWKVGFAAVLLSEVLIILDWRHAKFGTIVNIIIMLAIMGSFGTWDFLLS